MKIGILTYHRTLNYGACLQAVATRVVLEKMGHEAYYVDYWPEYHQMRYSAFSLKKLKYISFLGGCKYIVDSIKNFKHRKQRIENFSPFFNKYIYPYCRSTNDKYDVIIYGSDQIWRKHKELKDYNPVYFGANNFKTKKHIAFSASMGVLPSSEKDLIRVKNLAKNIDKIAVRENDLQELLLSLGFDDVLVTLDPTLLLNKVEWRELLLPVDMHKKKYMLLYYINKCVFDINKIRAYADQHGCELIVLTGKETNVKEKTVYTTEGPFSFLYLIQNAECIFTSSFHGLAFSIIFEKEFFTSYSNNSNRAETLLKSIGVNDRIISPLSDIPFLPQLDYKKINQNLVKLRDKSLDYLKNI